MLGYKAEGAVTLAKLTPAILKGHSFSEDEYRCQELLWKEHRLQHSTDPDLNLGCNTCQILGYPRLPMPPCARCKTET